MLYLIELPEKRPEADKGIRDALVVLLLIVIIVAAIWFARDFPDAAMMMLEGADS